MFPIIYPRTTVARTAPRAFTLESYIKVALVVLPVNARDLVVAAKRREHPHAFIRRDGGLYLGTRGVNRFAEVFRGLVHAVLETGAVEERLPGFAQRVILDQEMARRLVQLHTRLEASRDPFAGHSATVLTLTEFFRRHSTARPSSLSGTNPRHSLERARELVHDSYADRISLSELSNCAGLSPFHFLRVFFREFSLTPHAYLNQIRVREAKRKLSAGAPCAVVALECGFCDQSHMLRVFKRSTGVTPGQYRIAHTRGQATSSQN